MSRDFARTSTLPSAVWSYTYAHPLYFSESTSLFLQNSTVPSHDTNTHYVGDVGGVVDLPSTSIGCTT